MENRLEKIVYSNNVIEFLTIATEYCNFMDSLTEFGRKEFVERSLKLLPLLYIKASLLPSISVEDILEVEKFATQEEWQYVHNKVREIVLEFDSYSETEDPYDKENDNPVLSSLSENFADIYQDTKDFVSLYGIGSYELMRDAIAECKTNFETYWGQGLNNAMRALHFIYYSKKVQFEISKNKEESNNTDDWFISQKQQDWEEDE